MSTADPTFDSLFPQLSTAPGGQVERVKEALAKLRRSRSAMAASDGSALRRGIERVDALIDGLTQRLHALESRPVAASPLEAWAVLVDADGREVSRRAFCVIEPDAGDGNRRLDRSLELEGEAEEMARAVSLRLIGCDGGVGEVALDRVGSDPLWFERTA